MGRTIKIAPTLTTLAIALASELLAQQPPVATFKSGVDVVRIAAVVRDHKGRFVRDLSARDFEVLDGGWPRTITDFRPDTSGISVALLFDVSGAYGLAFGVSCTLLLLGAGLSLTLDEAGRPAPRIAVPVAGGR